MLLCIENAVKGLLRKMKIPVELSVNVRHALTNTASCATVAWSLLYERLADASVVCSFNELIVLLSVQVLLKCTKLCRKQRRYAKVFKVLLCVRFLLEIFIRVILLCFLSVQLIDFCKLLLSLDSAYGTEAVFSNSEHFTLGM